MFTSGQKNKSASNKTAVTNESSNDVKKSSTASQMDSKANGHPLHNIVSASWKRDHPSAFSPYKPTTVLTNLQRGNVQTQTLTVPAERSIYQLAAQGELFFENIDDFLSPEEPDSDGYTPLMWAAAYGQLETVRHLITLGAAVSTVAPSGENALLFASAAGHSPIVKELLNHGASVDYKDKDGNTALMYAAYNDNAACVQELLSAGADFTILNESLESAYDIALRKQSKHAQAVLEKCMVNILVEVKES